MDDVWLYPRPPAVVPCWQEIRVEFAGYTILTTRTAFKVLETSHPPVYYLPRGDFRDCALEAEPGTSFCEWKGKAAYWSIRVGDRVARRVAWSYPRPEPAFEVIRDHLAIYAGPMDAVYVDDEKATPQPGGFYGGWVTGNLKGPFKGGPGTMGW